jgi:hypothetical protein
MKTFTFTDLEIIVLKEAVGLDFTWVSQQAKDYRLVYGQDAYRLGIQKETMIAKANACISVLEKLEAK